MKKLITLLLVLCGGISQASATDYYIGASTVDYGSSWEIQGQMIDMDGDGTYSLIIQVPSRATVESVEKFYDFCFTIFSSSTIAGDWSNAFRPKDATGDFVITNNNDEVEMDESNSNNFTIKYPNDWNGDEYRNYASALKLDYTPTTKKLKVTRLIAVSSGHNGWSTTTDYLTETANGSKVYTGRVTLEDGTNTSTDGFKYVFHNYGWTYWGAKKANNTISDKEDDSSNTINVFLANDGVYDMTANLSTWAWTDPTLVTVPASVGTYGKATLCSEYALDFSGFSGEDAAVKAYRITGAADGVLTPTRVTGRVKAGTGLYIEGAANASINVPTTIETSDPGTNFLKGVTENTNIVQSPAAGVNNYILTVNTKSGTADKPRFYLVNGTSGNTVKAGKAYLQITSGGGARDFYWFAEDVTAIDAGKQEQKVDGEAYNLAGQRVSKPSKGLYIVNGKKVIIK